MCITTSFFVENNKGFARIISGAHSTGIVALCPQCINYCSLRSTEGDHKDMKKNNTTKAIKNASIR